MGNNHKSEMTGGFWGQEDERLESCRGEEVGISRDFETWCTQRDFAGKIAQVNGEISNIGKRSSRNGLPEATHLQITKAHSPFVAASNA